MKPYELSASLICADLLNIGHEIKEIERAGVDRIHFDVMDGVFVPRYGLFPEVLAGVTSSTKLPVEVHMMVTNPEPYIPDFAKAGAESIYVHVEGNNHLHRTLQMIRQHGVKAGVVYNPATPFCGLEYILPFIDGIMLMAINPGIVGHKIIPQVYDKIRELKSHLVEYPDVKIMIDGGVAHQTAAQMVQNGADILVCGTSSIYRPKEGTLDVTTKRFRDAIDQVLTQS